MEKKLDIVKYGRDVVRQIPAHQIGEIGKDGMEIIKLVVQGYNQRENFRLIMAGSAQVHQEVMAKTQAISDYRTTHLNNLMDIEKSQLTTAFCKKMLNQE